MATHTKTSEAPAVTMPLAVTWACGTCKFYDPNGSLCRYNPPMLTAGAPSTVPVNAGITTFPPQVSYWPVVEANDWCGQYLVKA